MDTTADVIDPSAPIQFEMKEPGLYAIKGFPEGLPYVDEATKKLARGITNDDAATLVLRFKKVEWTQASLQRVLEVYTLAKRETDHEEMLKVRYANEWPGHRREQQDYALMCPNCFQKWTSSKVKGTCILCKKQVIAVDRAPFSKEQMAVDLGDYAERPLSATDGTGQCFADQVPLALRVRLKHEVAKQPFPG